MGSVGETKKTNDAEMVRSKGKGGDLPVRRQGKPRKWREGAKNGKQQKKIASNQDEKGGEYKEKQGG